MVAIPLFRFTVRIDHLKVYKHRAFTLSNTIPFQRPLTGFPYFCGNSMNLLVGIDKLNK